MPDRSRIALIHPRFPPRQGMLAHLEYEPIGLLMISAALKKKGFDICLFEQNPTLSAGSLARQVIAWRPAAVGISVFTANFPEGRRIAVCLKNLGFSGPIVFGGIHATTAPDIVLEPAVDYVLRGEGEVAGPLLFDALLNGGSIMEIPGIVYKSDGRSRETAPFELIADLTSLPWADHSSVSIRREYSLRAYGYPKATVMSSRGCRSTCTFCTNAAVTRRKVRFRDPDDVVREIEYLKNTHGIHFVNFHDADFFSNAEHTESICRTLIRRRTNVPFFCEGRIDLLDEGMLDLLASAKCIRLFFGLERAPGESAWTFKARDGQKVENILRRARAKGITTQVGFIIGFPDEDSNSLASLETYIRQIQADYLNVTIATPFHSTMLRDLIVLKGMELSQDEQSYKYDSLAYKHPFLSEDDLIGWRQKLYRAFYFGNPYLRRTFIQVMARPAIGIDYVRMFYRSVRGGLFAGRQGQMGKG